MKIHVTGGKGFLGCYIVRALAESHEVEVSDKNTVDVTDFNNVLRVFESSKPDLIVHLAALCGAKPSVEQPQEFFNVNAQGTVNVLEVCRIMGISQFLFTSSLTVHGTGNEAMTEDSPYAPRHPYAAAKVAAEMATQIYAQCYGLSTIILRPTLVVGEAYKEPHAIGDFVETARSGDDIEIFGTGDHKRDFVHPDDVTRAAITAVNILADAKPGYREIINISNGQPISMSDLANLVIDMVGSGSMTFAPPTAQMFSLFSSNKKSEALLSWKPQIGVDEIIRRLQQ